MEQKDVLQQYYQTVRELIKDKPILEKIFVPSRVASNLDRYDNWNNDVDTYIVNIQVPVNLFKEIEANNNVQEFENEITNAFRTAMKGDANQFVRDVSIVPYAEIGKAESMSGEHNVRAWAPGYFRMFISHVSTHKKSAENLKIALADYGISGFVAHIDIEPTREWQEEILAALQSMDALCAILTDDFNNSKWCDQEVGFGLGRNVLCIPIRHGMDPYGILGRQQGTRPLSDARKVAKQVFKLLCSNEKSRDKYISVLSGLFLNAPSSELALKWLGVLKQVETLNKEDVNYIRTHISDSYEPIRNTDVLREVNEIFHNFGIRLYQNTKSSDNNDFNDLPF